MGLRFCMFEGVSGGQVAINVASVVAVRANGGQSVVVYQGGEIAVRGVVAEVILKLIVTEGQPALGAETKAAA